MLSFSRSHPWLEVPAVGRRFFAWWLEELTALIPARLRRMWRTDPRRLSIVVLGADFEICTGTPDPDNPAAAGKELFRGAWSGIESLLRVEKRRIGPLLTITVRVPISACLVRDKHLPERALEQAEALLLLDLEQATPLKREDVYWGWYHQPFSTSGGVEVRQLVLKRSRINPIIDRLEALGLSPVAIEVDDEDGRVLPVNLWSGKRQLPNLEAWLRRVLMASAVVAVILAVLVAGLAIYRQEQALASLQAETESFRQKAADVRKKLAGVEAALSQVVQVRLRKTDTPSVVQLWDELTRVLPDSTWITEFKLEGAGIAIDGFAPSASELIALLARSAYFREVAFASPVTRDPQRGLERFQIRMRVERSAIQSGAVARATP